MGHDSASDGGLGGGRVEQGVGANLTTVGLGSLCEVGAVSGGGVGGAAERGSVAVGGGVRKVAKDGEEGVEGSRNGMLRHPGSGGVVVVVDGSEGGGGMVEVGADLVVVRVTQVAGK